MSATKKIETTADLRQLLAEGLAALEAGEESMKKLETMVKGVRAMCTAIDSETRTMKAQHAVGHTPKPFGSLRIVG